MRHWQQLTAEDRKAVLEIVSARMGLPQLAVEKDWWVTMVLKALSMTRHFRLMSFKGGTSLSKGWNLIKRFSEDIDIAIRRDGIFSVSSTSANQLTKVRRKVRHYVIRELPGEIEQVMREMGIRDFSVEPETERTDAWGNKVGIGPTTHPSTVYVSYRSILPEISEYIDSRVKIEISCLSMDEPVEMKAIRSFVSEVLGAEEDVEVLFPTVVPTRTFLEKIFLLHEEFQRPNPRSKRMTRHLYDIEKMMDTAFGQAISDRRLYDSVVKHRSIFNKIDGVDYSLHVRDTLSCLPPKQLLSDWERDYVSMRQNFIFDENSLPFSQLLERIMVLLTRIKNAGEEPISR